MRSNWKRFAALAVVLVMAMTLLAACGGGGDAAEPAAEAGGSSAPAGAEPAADEAGGGEEITLEFWHIQNTEPTHTTIQDSVNRFMADNPNVKVNISPMANDAYKQKLAVAMSSGQMPDVFISFAGGPMNEYIDSGHIMDITSYMEADGYKDKFMDGSIAQSSYNGKIYGLPVENVSTAAIFYNKEIFEQYSLEIPTTLSELEAICDTLVENGVIPFSLANKTQWPGSIYYMYFAIRMGGTQPFKDALTGTGSFDSETFEYAGTKLQEWVDKGYFNEGFNGADEDTGQSRQLLYTGDAAMTLMGSWFVGEVMSENAEYYEKVGYFNFPAIEDSDADPSIVVGTLGDNFYHISNSCEYPDEAFEMMTYLLDDTAIEERIQNGRILPMKDMPLDDPILQAVLADVEKAPDVQLWYDQSLPPEVAEVHKTTSQEIFGKTMTPKAADEALQAAMEAYLAQKNG